MSSIDFTKTNYVKDNYYHNCVMAIVNNNNELKSVKYAFSNGIYKLSVIDKKYDSIHVPCTIYGGKTIAGIVNEYGNPMNMIYVHNCIIVYWFDNDDPNRICYWKLSKNGRSLIESRSVLRIHEFKKAMEGIINIEKVND